MTEETAKLRDQVLDALAVDKGVGASLALQWKGDTFVIGYRETATDTWGTMIFIIALEILQGSMGGSGHGSLQELKEGWSAHSSTKGTAWFGIASTVETALRISKGEVQLEPPR